MKGSKFSAEEIIQILKKEEQGPDSIFSYVENMVQEVQLITNGEKSTMVLQLEKQEDKDVRRRE